MSREMNSLLNHVCKKHLEEQYERLTGKRIRVTQKILDDYCKASAEIERETEIQAAIALLEDNGYKVKPLTKPKRIANNRSGDSF